MNLNSIAHTPARCATPLARGDRKNVLQFCLEIPSKKRGARQGGVCTSGCWRQVQHSAP